MEPELDANRRLAQLAAWLGDAAHWIDEHTRAQTFSGGPVALTVDSKQMRALVNGLRITAQTLAMLVRPRPQPLRLQGPTAKRHLRLIVTQDPDQA